MDIAETQLNMPDTDSQAVYQEWYKSVQESSSQGLDWLDTPQMGDEVSINMMESGPGDYYDSLDFDNLAEYLDDDEIAMKTLVNPSTLNPPSPAEPNGPTQFSNQMSSVNTGEKLRDMPPLEEFFKNHDLIVCALQLSNYEIPDADEGQEDLTSETEAQGETAVSARLQVAANTNNVGTTSRRKSSIEKRNIQEFTPAAAIVSQKTETVALNSVSVEIKPKNPLKRVKKTQRQLKKKMHELDPAQFPQAKGARYSHERRELMKKKLADAIADGDVSKKTVQVLLSHIQYLYGIMVGNGIVGEPEIANMQKSLEQQLTKVQQEQ